MFIISIILASIAVIPFALKTFRPYLWMDILYFGDLLRIMATFVSRIRRNAFYSVLDRFMEQTAAQPDKVFVVFNNDRHTYSDADRRSNKIANALQKDARFKAGATVALFMGNEPAFLFTWLALAKLGSAVALLNYNIRNKSLLHCFNCCGANVLIAAAGMESLHEFTHETWLSCFRLYCAVNLSITRHTGRKRLPPVLMFTISIGPVFTRSIMREREWSVV